MMKQRITTTIVRRITTLERRDIKQQSVTQTDGKRQRQRDSDERQNTALIVPDNNGTQTTLCFHIL